MKLFRQSAWLFLLMTAAGYLPGKSLTDRALPTIKDTTCRLQLTGGHYNLFCLDEASVAEVPAPTISNDCGAEVQLSFKERYDDLSCGSQGFTGYFEPTRWMISKTYGDNGVDVTGAPDALLVEGADNTLVSATPGGATRIQILIPADGVVAFDWRAIGSSPLFSNSFQIAINEQIYPLTASGLSEGRFRRPVQTGDELSFRLSAPEPVAFQLDNFRLLTNAIGAFQRIWTATDATTGHSDTFTQLITIEQPSIVEVIFPDDLREVPPTREATAPQATGYPYFDRDGNPATIEDQYQLQDDNCAYRVEHIDELQRIDDACILVRRWIVTDACGDNTMQETQLIHLEKTSPTSDDCPEQLLFPATVLPENDQPEVLPSEISSQPLLSAEKNDQNTPMTL